MSPDEKKGSAGEHSPLSPVDILEDSESTTATAVSEGKDPRGPPTLDKDRDAGGRTPGRSGDSSFINEVPEGHVSYRRAREEFAQLERKYSGLSQGSGELRRRTTTKSMSMSVGSALAGPSTTPSTETDIEAAAGAGEKIEDEFNLANELHSGRQLANDAGIKHKKVGVVWEDLEVIGAGGMKMHIRNFSNADIEQFILPPIKIMGLLGFKPFAPKPRTILHKTTGVLKPGEMCLVLGRPGSGCSTFLKTIANQRDSFMKVNGNVEYAGVHAKEMHKYYGGEVLYNQEDDDHLPTLTVGQTLRFALELKTPKKRIPGVSTTQYRDALLNLLLSMLNIKHTENTIVGNAHVRGVSGGERKRVSIAEQFCSGACLSSWDNSTRGLDASTALDYAKSLRLLTDIMNQTSFVSLYQAGEGIYDQFDKVLVLNEGYVVYFGSCKEARGYFVSLGFEDMPRQTTPDYLSGCTDPNERRYQEGCDTSNVPSTPEAMATAYQQSEIYRRMVAAKDEYKAQMEGDERDREQFRKAILEQKHRGVHHNSPYTVSLPAQIWAITKRQTILKFQDRFSIYSGYFTAIAISLIVGSVFYQLPLTSAGVFTRGGILFLGLLFNALTSFSELPTQMMGRPILFRQVGYRFYRPAAYAVAAVLSDIPYNSSNIFIFCIVLYFMGGLYSSAGAFFIFFLLIFTTFMVMSAFFRTIGVACGNYNVAARLASFTVSVFCTYTGYMIPLHSMKRWLFWISYTNPLYYGYEAIFANEFHRITFRCEGNYVIPHNIPSVVEGLPNTVGPYQVCTIPGSIPGDEYVTGTSYMHTAFHYTKAHIWRNFGILMGFFCFFMFLQAFFLETLNHRRKHLSIVVFKRGNKKLKAANARLAERREEFRSGKLDQDLSHLSMKPQAFTWENLKYTVPVPGGHKMLLNSVFGYVKPGTLTALMGASGAGKTTLLDVLAARKNIGVIEGDILMNARPIDKSFARGCAYAEQLDVHEWTTTVREAFMFSAMLRQPPEVPIEEKEAYVEDIIELLELQDLADGMIGFPGFGLSVEARKRVTIGVELAAKPELLLFLDEPTSGLDSQSAFNIVRFLKKLTAAGQKILCTIHQPNSLLFQSFDRLLLLQRGGECVYFGDIGEDSKVLIQYLEANGATVPADCNPAEEMLNIIGAGSRKRVGGDWHQKWLNSPEFAKVKEEIKVLKEEALAAPAEENEHDTEYATPFYHQFKVVLKRTTVALWRNADYQYTRLFAHLAIGLVVTLTFLQLNNSLKSLQYRVFVVFFGTILPALILAQIEPQYIMSRMVFNREASSKMYSSTIFALTQLIAEMPYSILCAVCFFLLVYYGVGLPSASDRSGYFFIMIVIVEIYAVTLGQAVAALCPSITVAALFNPFLLVLFSVFSGVTAPPATLPTFWRSWMYHLDPFTYLIEGLVSDVLQDVPVRCRENEFYSFDPPPGQTCIEYAGRFASAVGGYFADPDASTDCRYCQYSWGQNFFAGLNIKFIHRWRNFAIFIGYTCFNVGVLLVAARLFKWRKR